VKKLFSIKLLTAGLLIAVSLGNVLACDVAAPAGAVTQPGDERVLRDEKTKNRVLGGEFVGKYNSIMNQMKNLVENIDKAQAQGKINVEGYFKLIYPLFYILHETNWLSKCIDFSDMKDILGGLKESMLSGIDRDLESSKDLFETSPIDGMPHAMLPNLTVMTSSVSPETLNASIKQTGKEELQNITVTEVNKMFIRYTRKGEDGSKTEEKTPTLKAKYLNLLSLANWINRYVPGAIQIQSEEALSKTGHAEAREPVIKSLEQFKERMTDWMEQVMQFHSSTINDSPEDHTGTSSSTGQGSLLESMD